MPTKKQQTNKAYQGMLMQPEVNYVPMSSLLGKGCASCRWFHAAGDEMNNSPHCHLVESWPEPILATGYCDRHEVLVPRILDVSNPLPVVIVEPPVSMEDSAEMALPTTRRGLKELILNIFKGTPQPQPEQAFTTFKGQDGKWYWMARHTGKYVDREDEIIADHAHEEFVTRVQKGLVPMPELWTWHKKGTSHGVADFVWKSGGFVRAIGHFTGSKEQIERAVAYYQKMGDKIKLSHMFKYPKRGKKGKVYHAYNTVEITTLPDGAEAFPYTTFEGLGNMPFTKEQEDQIRAIGGDEMWQRAQAADSKDLADTKTNDAAGIASKTTKDVENFEGSIIPGDEEIKALETAAKDNDMRLKELDTRLKALESIKDSITSLEASFKSLGERLETVQKAESDALKVANDTAKKLAEYQAVEPPASQSKDTLLDAREKSLIEQISESVKQDGSKSLLDQIFGATPAVSG